MAIVKISGREMRKFDPIEPGWYKAKAVNLKEEMNKAKDGKNFKYTFRVTEGPEAEKELDHWFSDKAIHMMGPFVQAAEKVEIGKDDEVEVDPEKMLGKEVFIEVENEVYAGQLRNKIKNFARADQDPPFDTGKSVSLEEKGGGATVAV